VILVCEPGAVVPRAVILSGKAAPGYAIAKLLIKLILHVAQVSLLPPPSSLLAIAKLLINLILHVAQVTLNPKP